MTAKKPVYELPVKYGSVTFGDTTVSISISMSRGKLKPNQIDEIFTGKRLTMKLFAGVAGSKDGQKTAFEDGDLTVEAVFDSTGFGTKAKSYTATLSTAITSVDSKEFSQFAKRDGRAEISAIADDEDDAE